MIMIMRGPGNSGSCTILLMDSVSKEFASGIIGKDTVSVLHYVELREEVL